MSKIKNFALDLSTVTTEDLVKTLDERFNYTMGWKSTVFSQKNLEDIAHNVLQVLSFLWLRLMQIQNHFS